MQPTSVHTVENLLYLMPATRTAGPRRRTRSAAAGVIPRNVFTMLVLMAIVTTITTAPLLHRWLPRIGHVIPARRDA
jgi:hypothetical protein